MYIYLIKNPNVKQNAIEMKKSIVEHIITYALIQLGILFLYTNIKIIAAIANKTHNNDTRIYKFI